MKSPRSQLLPASRLHPNDYNPNRMTDSEFNELLAEVRHLGHLPKPVVVRPNGDGFTIIDGEHGWRAATEIGLAEVPCEVIEADDFEAMRQTYKRNQHGTHCPVLLGRMFRAMMADRELSIRALAQEMTVSEGTIRNALEYDQATGLRNSYAFDQLSLRQVRFYNRLPRKVADLWLDGGADLKAIWDVKTSDDVERKESWGADSLIREFERLEATGLFEYVGSVSTASAFREQVSRVRKWDDWEREWAVGGLTREQLRPYLSHCYRNVFYVREQWLMDSALDVLVDHRTRPPCLRLTPEEFEAVLQKTDEQDSASAGDFMDELLAAIIDKTGELPDESLSDQRQDLAGRDRGPGTRLHSRQHLAP